MKCAARSADEATTRTGSSGANAAKVMGSVCSCAWCSGVRSYASPVESTLTYTKYSMPFPRPTASNGRVGDDESAITGTPAVGAPEAASSAVWVVLKKCAPHMRPEVVHTRTEPSTPAVASRGSLCVPVVSTGTDAVTIPWWKSYL